MQVIKGTKQEVITLPTRVALLGKDLGKAGKLWLEAVGVSRPDHGYVDVMAVANPAHIMRVKVKNLLTQKPKATTALGLALALAGY